MLFRNYADWLWSAYNFWCNYKYDFQCCNIDPVLKKCDEVGYWVDPAFHHRSPSTFHDIILGSINGTHVESPMVDYVQQPCEHGKRFTQHFIEMLWADVPEEHTLFIATEVMEKHPAAVWKKVARRVGLNEAHPKLQEFASVRYNVQVSKKSRGVHNYVAAKDFTAGVYLVSGFKPQLNETRRILDSCWATDCAVASIVTRYQYAACKGVTNVSIDSSLTNKLRRYLEIDGDQKRWSFFDEVTHSCRVAFSAASDKAAVQHPQSFLQILSRITASSSTTKSGGILIFSTSIEDRMFLFKLLFFSVRAPLVFDTEDSQGELCQLRSTVRAPVGEDPMVIIGTHPSNIRKTSGGWKLVQSVNLCGNFTLKTSQFVFTKIIALTRDPVNTAWMRYLGASKISSEWFFQMDWEHWERAAIRLLTNASSRSDLVRMNEIWVSGSSANRMAVRMEDILYSSSRIAIVSKILRFASDKLQATGDTLRCAYLLLSAHERNRSSQAISSVLQSSFHNSRSTIDIAYASVVLICKIRELFTNNALLMTSLSLPAPSTSIEDTNGASSWSDQGHNCSNVESKSALQKKCKVRYMQRTYAPTVRVYPTALLVIPGPRAVNVRLLIEHSTGIYTGNIETDFKLISVLPGEAFCGQRMSVVTASPIEATFKFLRSGAGAISMSKKSINKCMKGYIRGLNRSSNSTIDFYFLIPIPFLPITEACWLLRIQFTIFGRRLGRIGR